MPAASSFSSVTPRKLDPERITERAVVTVDKRLYSELRRLDRHDLRRVAMYVGGLLAAAGDEAGGNLGEEGAGGVTYRSEYVRCGKPGCRTCPHGPYWYAYYREGGKLRSRYLGRGEPDAAATAVPPREG